MTHGTPELLAPAGGIAQLKAAVQSGADAVYMGGYAFNARRSAKNFTADEMREMIRYCHLYGVKVHVAVNTLIHDRELPELLEYVYMLNEMGADALILQDIGAAKMIKTALPEMELHASTQMTVTSIEGVQYLEQFGFDRVVLARELSKNEIEAICRSAHAEIEVFVHLRMLFRAMSDVLRFGRKKRKPRPMRTAVPPAVYLNRRSPPVGIFAQSQRYGAD